MIRESIGSIGPQRGFEFDQPSYDLIRDKQYELSEQLRKGAVYDPEAANRTTENI